MKKYVFILLTILFILISYIIIGMVKKEQHILLRDGKVKYNIIASGLKDARDFSVNGDEVFIAFKNKIQVIEKSGKSYMLLEDNNLDIRELGYYNGNLYFLSGSSLFSLHVQDGKRSELMKDIPNYGDYEGGSILINNGMLYLSIGAATNSGVVGEDNVWKDTYPFNYDILPKDIVISEKVDSKFGAFVPYNTKNIPGQKIPGHFPGNSSVIIYNINKKNTSLFCWGLRNVNGMDYDSQGRIIATVGGMEPRGRRPVNGDVDYIYELKEGIWYGWPDYSGGDPINSPRFKGLNGEKLQFLLQKHPSSNPPAPLYQHKSLSSLSALAIDRNGILGEKDCIYFYDNKDNILYSMSTSGVVSQKLRMDNNLKLKAIKSSEKGIMLLEQNDGYLLVIGNEEKTINSNSNIIIIYTTGLIITIICILVWKTKK